MKALSEKVSRERLLKELDGMLYGKQARPALALWILYQLNIFDTIFSTDSFNVANIYPRDANNHIIEKYRCDITELKDSSSKQPPLTAILGASDITILT